MVKSIALLLLLLCFQFRLLLASPARDPLPAVRESPSSPGVGLDIPSAKNVVAVGRKGGRGSGGHGGRSGGGRGRGRSHIIPFYGRDRGSHRSNGSHHSGSYRFFSNAILNTVTLLFTAILVAFW